MADAERAGPTSEPDADCAGSTCVPGADADHLEPACGPEADVDRAEPEADADRAGGPEAGAERVGSVCGPDAGAGPAGFAGGAEGWGSQAAVGCWACSVGRAGRCLAVELPGFELGEVGGVGVAGVT